MTWDLSTVGYLISIRAIFYLLTVHVEIGNHSEGHNDIPTLTSIERSGSAGRRGRSGGWLRSWCVHRSVYIYIYIDVHAYTQVIHCAYNCTAITAKVNHAGPAIEQLLAVSQSQPSKHLTTLAFRLDIVSLPRPQSAVVIDYPHSDQRVHRRSIQPMDIKDHCTHQ